MSPRTVTRAGAAALLLTIGGGVAWAQGVEGGCTASVNGRPPASLTADNALEVEKGQVVSVTGTVPPSVAGKKSIESTTELQIFTGDLGGIPFETIEGTGPEWGGEAEVPDALFDYAPGIYLVGGEATGTGGWSCEGSGYINIVGGPWTAALAAGGVLAVAGLFLLKSARGPIRSASDTRVRRAAEGKGLGSTSDFQDAMDEHMTHDQPGTESTGTHGTRDSVDAGKGGDASGSLQESMGDKPAPQPTEGSTHGTRTTTNGGKESGGGRSLKDLMADHGATRRLDALGLVAGAVPIALVLTGTVGSASAIVSGLIFAVVPDGSRTRFWVRGRPIRGFFGGLVAGVGLALILHQFDLWAFASESFAYVPLALALLGALRGWWGRAYTTG